MSAAEHPEAADTAEAVFYRAVVAAEALHALTKAALRAVYEAARAEGEAAGRAAERAAVVAYLRDRGAVIEDHCAMQDAIGESRLVVVHVVPRDAAADIEAGAHVAPADG